MKYKILLFTLTFTLSLFSQFEWSDPVQLSELGIYPDITYNHPAITVSNDSTIHAFWVKGTEYDTYKWYSQIEYRKSLDGGLTWSETENLTPEYTENRIYEMKAVSDSNNNVHLIYLRSSVGSEYCKVTYKKYNGITWSDPYVIYDYATKRIRLGVDSTDRIYVTWSLNYDNCYTYCDDGVWNSVELINDSIYTSVKDFVFDTRDNIYAIGTTGEVNNYRPIIFKYDKSNSKWIDFKIFQDYDTSSSGCALALSSKDSIYTNTIVGIMDVNNNYIQEKHVTDSLWSTAKYLNSNNDWDNRQMFIDKKDNLHLFENHLVSTASLIYSNRRSGVWTTESIQEEVNYSYDNLNVGFDNIDRFFTTYRKVDNVSLDAAVYFQTKKIDTGIEDSDKLLVMSYELDQNYPNPFNNQTNIEYAIQDNSEIEINIFNSNGQFVQSLVNEKQGKGKHSVQFKADNLNSGIYYYRLKIDGMVKETKKMLFLK